MSDRLAPLLERQGPWLLQIGATKEDFDCWGAYIALNDTARQYLRKIRRTVEQLRADMPESFRNITYWSVGDVRFLEQGIHNNPPLEEFVEELTTGNTDQLLIPDHFIEIIKGLGELRTDGELIYCGIDGVYWSAQDHYSGTVYTTNTLAWSDI